MKLDRVVFALVASVAVVMFMSTVGCEDSSNKGASDGSFVVTERVVAKDHAADGLRFRTDNWSILIGPDTVVSRQRPSCSGFNVESGDAIQIGDTLEFDARDSVTSYDPFNSTTPSYVNAYRQECMSGQEIQEPIIIHTNAPCPEPCGCD